MCSKFRIDTPGLGVSCAPPLKTVLNNLKINTKIMNYPLLKYIMCPIY